MALSTSGTFYNQLSEKRKDSADLKSCIEKTVAKLLGSETDLKNRVFYSVKYKVGKQEPSLE